MQTNPKTVAIASFLMAILTAPAGAAPQWCGGGGGAGGATTWTRLETSQSLLNIDWNGAAPCTASQIADREAAVEELAAGDPRPLLLYLDDQKLKEGEDNAKVQGMLDAALKSERFQLASTWFHCVRMDASVLDKDSPYYPLFEGNNPPRLVLVSRKAERYVPFLGTTSQGVNWADIASVLKVDYKKDATRAVKGIERLLSKFDAVDNRIKELNAQLERATEAQAASKIKKLQAKLAEEDKERQKLFDEKKELEDLGLRAPEAKKAD